MKNERKHTTYGKHRETCLMWSALKYCAKFCEVHVTSAIYGKRKQTMENKRNVCCSTLCIALSIIIIIIIIIIITLWARRTITRC